MVSEIFQMYLVSQALILVKIILEYRRPTIDYIELLIDSDKAKRLAEIQKMEIIE